MRFLRNPEVRLVLLPGALVAILSMCVLSRMLKNNVPSAYILWLVGLSFLLLLLIFLYVGRRHSEKVKRFSHKVEKNLHGHQDLQFDSFTEGDFAVLQDVIEDMVIAHFRQEEALRTEKLLLKQSLADISHQIKTPLAALSLSAEQLTARELDSADRKRLARRMLDLIARIDGFVATLLKISRLDAEVVRFRKDVFSAQALIDHACEPLEPAMELRELTLERDVPPEISIEGDMRWLSEALTNIIKNCMEHTPGGGRIEIHVSENAVYTKIVIRDTGVGIAPEDLPHVFERYYKGKDSGAGSVGIGLAFTQMVIRSMGGTIKAENHPETGAVFTIHLIKINV